MSHHQSIKIRSITTAIFLTGLLSGHAVFVSAARAEQSNETATVQYTLAEQRLIDAGFPTTEDPWITKDFKAATDAIVSVAQNDPAGLARWNEDGTGLISRLLVEFKHVTDSFEEVLSESERAEYYLKAQEYIGPFATDITLQIWQAYSYLPDGSGMLYEREMLAMLEYVVRDFGFSALIMDELKQAIGKEDLQKIEEFNEKYKKYQVVSSRVTNAMINVIMNPGYKHPDLRATLFVDCKEAFTHLMEVMPKKDRDEAVFKLDTIMKFTQNIEEREAIGVILGKSSD